MTAQRGARAAAVDARRAVEATGRWTLGGAGPVELGLEVVDDHELEFALEPERTLPLPRGEVKQARDSVHDGQGDRPGPLGGQRRIHAQQERRDRFRGRGVDVVVEVPELRR